MITSDNLYRSRLDPRHTRIFITGSSTQTATSRRVPRGLNGPTPSPPRHSVRNYTEHKRLRPLHTTWPSPKVTTSTCPHLHPVSLPTGSQQLLQLPPELLHQVWSLKPCVLVTFQFTVVMLCFDPIQKRFNKILVEILNWRQKVLQLFKFSFSPLIKLELNFLNLLTFYSLSTFTFLKSFFAS